MVPHDAKVFANVAQSAPENCSDQMKGLLRLLATAAHDILKCHAFDCCYVVAKGY
jgi:hypothetical protein